MLLQDSSHQLASALEAAVRAQADGRSAAFVCAEREPQARAACHVPQLQQLIAAGQGHYQDRFVWQQREAIIETYNGPRSFVADGRTRFVQPGGNNAADGLTMANRLATIGRGMSLSSNSKDVVLIRGGGYNAVAEGLPLTINTPVTLAAWRGPVTISR